MEERAKRVKAIIFDVDGVLTDGKIYYTNGGDELRAFNVHDGMGIELLRKAGIKTFIITGKRSNIINRRAKDLKIDKVFQNSSNKIVAYKKILKAYNLNDDQVCFIGDDLLDLEVLRRVGFSVTVPKANASIKDVCCYVTQKQAGDGAVREVIEFILKAQNKWNEITQNYFC
ncbi:MAG: HAD-IIIA family hydrolase [Candidatus Omnitrophota bacterium]